MKFKFLKSVLILLTVLNVQLAWAQMPNCIPTGSNSSATQLTYCLIGDDYDFTINNNSRHTYLSKEISLDQQYYDMQFVFNNPNAEMLYIGIYLDLDEDGNYDYPAEKVFEGQSNGTNYSEVLTLTEAVLDQLDQGPKLMRMIVSGDQNSIYNTCEYPTIFTPYQGIDVRSGRVKIRKSTARHDPTFGTQCFPSNANMSSWVYVKNEFEVPIFIQRWSMGYGHNGNYCGLGALSQEVLPGPGSLDFHPGLGYFWEPSAVSKIDPGEEVRIEKVIANECWTPMSTFHLDVKFEYSFNAVPSYLWLKRKSFEYDDIEICADPIFGGGGGFSNGGSSSSDHVALAPSIAPNPTTGNATVSFDLSKESEVSVEIYNLLGERVLRERADNYTAGTHQMPLTTDHLPVGTYLVNVKVNNSSSLLTKLIIAR